MADFDTKAVSIMLTLNLHHFRNLQDVRAESTGLAALVNDENQFDNACVLRCSPAKRSLGNLLDIIDLAEMNQGSRANQQG